MFFYYYFYSIICALYEAKTMLLTSLSVIIDRTNYNESLHDLSTRTKNMLRWSQFTSYNVNEEQHKELKFHVFVSLGKI